MLKSERISFITTVANKINEKLTPIDTNIKLVFNTNVGGGLTDITLVTEHNEMFYHFIAPNELQYLFNRNTISNDLIIDLTRRAINFLTSLNEKEIAKLEWKNDKLNDFYTEVK